MSSYNIAPGDVSGIKETNVEALVKLVKMQKGIL
jgi:hypothetical protein